MRAGFNHLHIESDRLVIRQWQPSDDEPFARMNQDPEVMRYFPKHLTASESHAMIEKSKAGLEQDRHGFWALQSKDSDEFLGFVALARVQLDCKFTGSIEIGWRLKQAAWGKGFASEGARKLLEYGFLDLQLPEIVSIPSNLAMWRFLSDPSTNPLLAATWTSETAIAVDEDMFHVEPAQI